MTTRGGRGGRGGGRGNNVANNNDTVNNNDINGDVNNYDNNNNDNNNNARRRGRGSLNYRDWEVEILLNIVNNVNNILPLGADDWDQVATMFNASALTRSIQLGNNYVPRDPESLKNKFKSLKNHKKPTGDPNCPPFVKKVYFILLLLKTDNSL